MRPPRAGAAALLAAALVLAGTGAAAQVGDAKERARPAAAARAADAATDDPLRTLQSEASAWVDIGYDRPAAALAALRQRQASTAPEQDAWRVLALARGLVAASAGQAEEALQIADTLDQQAQRPGHALAVADAALLRAVTANGRGQGAQAQEHAQNALQLYDSVCAPGNASAGCDHRSAWLAQQLLSRQLVAEGKNSLGRESALAAAELALAHDDNRRQALSMAVASMASQRLGERDLSDRQASTALNLARLDGTAPLQAQLALFVSSRRAARGDHAGALQASQDGLRWAERAASPRLQAMLLSNLSDSYIHSGQPRLALQAVQRALPTVRQHHDLRAERVLLANAGLARLRLGEKAEARKTLEELLVAFGQSGASADQLELLHQFGEALAESGDLRGALDLYHRERQLRADMMNANRDAALAELSSRFDREAQQRKLDQLGRDNALIAQELDNRAARQRLWLGVGIALTLAMALVGLLYRRVRHVNLQLARNHEFLRVQSQRDPLTGLANRRGLAERVSAADAAFEGALLLVDIDHFKQVNDVHGHAGGDTVLVEVAKRLQAAVRDDDLVVRWGGEEFLIHAPQLGPAPARALAERVLFAVGEQPVALPGAAGGALQVTVSVGYGSFPLPGQAQPLDSERAINFADMALYTAKNQGRNRAVGIAALLAHDSSALRALEADFDAAWQDGRVQLHTTTGPQKAPAAAAPPAPNAGVAPASSAAATRPVPTTPA